MAMTMAYGKTLCWKGDKIGLKTKVEYRDQTGISSFISVKKFVELAKQCKESTNKEYFNHWIPLIEAKNLSIGVVLIDGLSRIAKELGSEKAYKCIIEKKGKK